MQERVLKRIPEFESEEGEREFWSTHDSVEYVDWGKTRGLRVPKLKPTTRTVSIRMPETMLEDLRLLARQARRALPIAVEDIRGRAHRRRAAVDQGGRRYLISCRARLRWGQPIWVGQVAMFCLT